MDRSQVPAVREDYVSRIQSYVNGDSDVQTTVKSIIAPIATQLSDPSQQDAAQTHFSILWGSIFKVARGVRKPYNLDPPAGLCSNALETFDKLHGFLDAMRDAPSLLPDQPKSATKQIATLPEFGATARDNFNFDSSSSSQADSSESWIDLNAFLAVLWKACNPASGYTQPEPYNYGLYSIWSLRDALETEHDAEELSALIPAAATWIFITGQIIASNDKQYPASKTTGAPARAGPLLADVLTEQGKDPKEITGFSSVRWQFWKERLKKIAADEDVDADTRAIAKAAFEQM